MKINEINGTTISQTKTGYSWRWMWIRSCIYLDSTRVGYINFNDAGHTFINSKHSVGYLFCIAESISIKPLVVLS